MKKIGLALGSGAARGLSQIGILLWLKENGIEVSCISGTSIGSIIGAAVSYGYTPEYLRYIVLDIKWTDLLKMLRLSIRGRSFLEWKKIDGFMRELFGERTIEEMKIPYGCVATDIDTGNEYVFRTGRGTEALRASACIPAIFPAVEMNGIHLVDGALVNPVPINLAFELGAEAVIGVNVNRSMFTERMTFGEDVPASRMDRVDSRVKLRGGCSRFADGQGRQQGQRSDRQESARDERPDRCKAARGEIRETPQKAEYNGCRN